MNDHVTERSGFLDGQIAAHEECLHDECYHERKGGRHRRVVNSERQRRAPEEHHRCTEECASCKSKECRFARKARCQGRHG